MPGDLDLVTFDRIAGVPVHYARQPVAEYGTKGKGPRKVRLLRPFKATLEACLLDLWAVCPWGKAEVLVSGGCYVEKAGRHGEGRAIDIDALWWTDQPPLITRNAPQDVVRYLGVEAVIRRHFGTVLDFWYNRAHEDHWHIDDGAPVGWREGSRALSLFLQASLVHVHGVKELSIDGVTGKATRSALASIQGAAYSLDINKTWLGYLELTAAAAFARV